MSGLVGGAAEDIAPLAEFDVHQFLFFNIFPDSWSGFSKKKKKKTVFTIYTSPCLQAWMKR